MSCRSLAPAAQRPSGPVLPARAAAAAAPLKRSQSNMTTPTLGFFTTPRNENCYFAMSAVQQPQDDMEQSFFRQKFELQT